MRRRVCPHDKGCAFVALVGPEFEGFPFGPDEGGVGFGEDVVVGEAVPLVVIAVALGVDVEEAGGVAGVAVEEGHCDFAAGERDASAGAGSWAG